MSDETPDDVEISVKDNSPEIISVQELINRMIVQANKFGNNSSTKLLLYNAARAIAELTTRLDAATQELKKLQPEPAKSSLIILPSAEN